MFTLSHSFCEQWRAKVVVVVLRFVLEMAFLQHKTREKTIFSLVFANSSTTHKDARTDQSVWSPNSMVILQEVLISSRGTVYICLTCTLYNKQATVKH